MYSGGDIGCTEDGGSRGIRKKINGRKQHAFVDTDGRGLVLEPHVGSVRDRKGGGGLLRISRRIVPFIPQVFADGGHAGLEGHQGHSDRRRDRAQEFPIKSLSSTPPPSCFSLHRVTCVSRLPKPSLSSFPGLR